MIYTKILRKHMEKIIKNVFLKFKLNSRWLFWLVTKLELGVDWQEESKPFFLSARLPATYLSSVFSWLSFWGLLYHPSLHRGVFVYSAFFIFYNAVLHIIMKICLSTSKPLDMLWIKGPKHGNNLLSEVVNTLCTRRVLFCCGWHAGFDFQVFWIQRKTW